MFPLKQLRTVNQRHGVIVALACLGVAIVLDFFEGLDPGSSLNIHTALANQFDFAGYTSQTFGQTEYAALVHFSKAIEESLEIIAMSLLWVTMLSHLFGQHPRFSIKAIPTVSET